MVERQTKAGISAKELGRESRARRE